MALPSSGTITFQDLLDEFAGGNAHVTATTDSGTLAYMQLTILGETSWYVLFTDDDVNFQKIYPGMRVSDDDEYFPGMVVTSWFSAPGASGVITLRAGSITQKLINEVNRGPNARALTLKFHATKAQQFTRYDSGSHRYGLVPDINANSIAPAFADVAEDTEDINFASFYSTTKGTSISALAPRLYVADNSSSLPFGFDLYFGNTTYSYRKVTLNESYQTSVTIPNTAGNWNLTVSQMTVRLGGEYRWYRRWPWSGRKWYHTYIRNFGWDLIDDDTGAIVHSSYNTTEEQKGDVSLVANVPGASNLVVPPGKTYRIAYTCEIKQESGVDLQLWESQVRPRFTFNNGTRTGRPLTPQEIFPISEVPDLDTDYNPPEGVLEP